MAHTPLPRRTLVYYALPELTQAVVMLPMALFVPAFYSDDLGLPLAGVGAAIAVSRLLDVIADPVIGVLSDRTSTRWGRRKPWIALGTPLLMLSAWQVFVPPAEVSLTYLFLWSTLLFLAFTLVDLPHKVWGAELSTDYLERNHVAAWREGLGATGLMVFLATLLTMGVAGHTESHEQLYAIALIIVLTLPPLVSLALIKVPEYPPEVLAGDNACGWRGLALAFRNRAFLRTLVAILLFGSAVMVQATLHKLVLSHVVGKPDLFVPLILGETLASIGAIPLWLRLAARFGKHRTATFAAVWIGFWSLGLPLVGEGDMALYTGLIVLRGSCLTSIFLLSNSIAADVVDQDILDSGRQRTGLFFAIWGIAVKGAVAWGVLLGTALPAAFGFEPSAATQPPEAKFWLMAIYGWLPCLFMAAGVPFLWNFPIGPGRQRELRARIARRRLH